MSRPKELVHYGDGEEAAASWLAFVIAGAKKTPAAPAAATMMVSHSVLVTLLSDSAACSATTPAANTATIVFPYVLRKLLTSAQEAQEGEPGSVRSGRRRSGPCATAPNKYAS